jgi:hypothetical protein
MIMSKPRWVLLMLLISLVSGESLLHAVVQALGCGWPPVCLVTIVHQCGVVGSWPLCIHSV